MVAGSLKTKLLLAISIAVVSTLFSFTVDVQAKPKASKGDAAADPTAGLRSTPAPKDGAPQVVQDWEQRLFFKNYAEDQLTNRLGRIEKKIFGEAIEGSDDSRLARLDELLKNKLAEEAKTKPIEQPGTAGGGGGGGTPTAISPAKKQEEDMERARLSIQAARDEEIAQLLAAGVELYRKKRGMEAQSKFEQVLRLDPNNAQAHFNLGIIEETMGNFVEALGSYKAAARREPDNPEYTEAVAAIEKKAAAQANSLGKRADLRALAEQANAAWKRGEYLSALDLYMQLDQKEPNRALVKYNIGSIYLMLKEAENALQYYEQAAKLGPGEEKYQKAYSELARDLKKVQKEQANVEKEAAQEWREARGEVPQKKGGKKGKEQPMKEVFVPANQAPQRGVPQQMQNRMAGAMGGGQMPVQQRQPQQMMQQPQQMMQQPQQMMQQPQQVMQQPQQVMQQPQQTMQQPQQVMQQPQQMMQQPQQMMQQPQQLMQQNQMVMQPQNQVRPQQQMMGGGQIPMQQMQNQMRPQQQMMGGGQMPQQQMQNQMRPQQQQMMPQQQTIGNQMMMPQNQIMGNQMGGGMMPNQMSGGMMGNQMSGGMMGNQMSGGMMGNQMGGGMMGNQMMGNQMGGAMMPNQMGGGMMPNQMGGGMMGNQMMGNQMGGAMMPQQQMMGNQMMPQQQMMQPQNQMMNGGGMGGGMVAGNQMMQPQQQIMQQSTGYGEPTGMSGGDVMAQFGFNGKSNGEGVTVVAVANGGRAATAGLVSGDDIKAVDGIQISGKQEILDILSRVNPAKRIPFLIMRNGNLAVLNL
jgi:tetratricopeptide (TPR) repeat protein